MPPNSSVAGGTFGRQPSRAGRSGGSCLRSSPVNFRNKRLEQPSGSGLSLSIAGAGFEPATFGL